MDQQAILMALKQLVAGDQLLTPIFSKYMSKEVLRFVCISSCNTTKINEKKI